MLGLDVWGYGELSRWAQQEKQEPARGGFSSLISLIDLEAEGARLKKIS